jgi:hypothetical protein
MKSLKTCLILAAAAGLLSLTISATGAAHLSAQGKPVTLVRDVDTAALRAFQAQLCVEQGGPACAEPNTLTVPAVTSTGEPVRRLVIEYVSGECLLIGSGSVSIFGITTVVNGVSMLHRLVPAPPASGSRTVAAQDTRLYADPGTEIRFVVSVSASNICTTAISGHLVVE